MTSLGKSEFPEMTVSEAIEVIEGVKREKAQTTSALGQVMGLTNVTTGFFYNKTSALSKFYGLIERQKTSIALTPLAKRIVYPVSVADRQAAIVEVASRVAIFNELYKVLGSEFHDLDFPQKLLALTGAKHDELEEKAPKVERLYRDALKYLVQQPQRTPKFGLEDILPTPGAPAPESSTPPMKGPTRTLQAEGDYHIRVALRTEAIEEAIAVLTALRNRVAHLAPDTGSTAEGMPAPDASPDK